MVVERPDYDNEKFKQRLRGMAQDDPLWPQLIALMEAFSRTETGPLVAPGLDDAEAHRLRGRVGMCLDLRDELMKLWNETHPRSEG